MRSLQFDEMALYARVAELGSLSAVARERDVPVSQVSRTLSRLEKACGARLMHRSTHGLSLTDEGRTFLAYSRRALDTIEELEGAFAEHTGEPSGVVRVSASTVVAQYQLVPSLAGLGQRHPRLQVELEVGDRLLDLAREGIDISIRTAASLPDTVVARQIGTLGRGLYAAPAYARDYVLAVQSSFQGFLVPRKPLMRCVCAYATMYYWENIVPRLPSAVSRPTMFPDRDYYTVYRNSPKRAKCKEYWRLGLTGRFKAS